MEFLSQKGVKYQELDVAADKNALDEMVKKTGRMAVPTIVVDDHVVVGFDKKELEKFI